MSLGAFLRRELLVLSRQHGTFRTRAAAVATASVVLGSIVVTLDWAGLANYSPAGMSAFTLRAFGALMVLHALGVWVAIPGEVAPCIALERERRTLDLLLSSCLTGAEIVFGLAGAGLVRQASRVVALFPITLLMMAWGGLDPRLVVVVYAALLSTTFLVTALGMAVGVHTHTRRGASGWAVLAAIAWVYVPLTIIILVPRIWPGRLRWVVPMTVPFLETSPIALLANLAGVVRRGSFLETLYRMIGLQLAAGLLLFLLAIAWLRRSTHTSGNVASNRWKLLRPRRRAWPPCGDDPILWYAMNAAPTHVPTTRIVSLLVGMVLVSGLAVATYWFARPAFIDLQTWGYRPVPEALRTSGGSPFAMAIARGTSLSPLPGVGRAEFNAALRQFTLFWNSIYALTLTGIAIEGIARERTKDTWSSLLATPLTGAEIVRAKMLGAVWGVKRGATVIVVLWMIALVAGAVHPLGFAMAIVGFGVSTWFLVAFATYQSLCASDVRVANNRVLLFITFVIFSPLLLSFLPRGGPFIMIGAGSLPFQSYLSLVSYEDFERALRSGLFPSLDGFAAPVNERAVFVLATCLIGVFAQAMAAFLLTRTAIRGFDAIVGRPDRS